MTPTLFELLVNAPLAGLEPGGEHRVIHALTMEGLVDGLRAPCGVSAKVLVLPWPYGGRPVLWPVQHRLPGPLSRCGECWQATGKKRPRSYLAPRDVHMSAVAAAAQSKEQDDR